MTCGDDAMRVNCTECGGKATIQSSKCLDVKLTKLYCSCSDPICGHTFVMDLSFSHTLSMSGQQSKAMIANFIRALPETERQQLLAL